MKIEFENFSRKIVLTAVFLAVGPGPAKGGSAPEADRTQGETRFSAQVAGWKTSLGSRNAPDIPPAKAQGGGQEREDRRIIAECDEVLNPNATGKALLSVFHAKFKIERVRTEESGFWQGTWIWASGSVYSESKSPYGSLVVAGPVGATKTSDNFWDYNHAEYSCDEDSKKIEIRGRSSHPRTRSAYRNVAFYDKSSKTLRYDFEWTTREGFLGLGSHTNMSHSFVLRCREPAPANPNGGGVK